MSASDSRTATLKLLQAFRKLPFQAVPLAQPLQEEHLIRGLLQRPDNQIQSLRLYRYQDDRNGSLTKVVVQLGSRIEGHVKLVHGGFLALLIDDVLGYGVETLASRTSQNQWHHAVTANLQIDFRQVVPADEGHALVFYIRPTETAHRKSGFQLWITNTEHDVLYCQATSLQVIPSSKL